MPLAPHEARVTTTGGIRATKGGKRWLVIFLSFVLAMLGGAAWLLWPMARVTVVPFIELITVNGSVVIDTSASGTIISSGVVPGAILAPGERAVGYMRAVVAQGHSYAYDARQAEAIVGNAVNKALGADYAAVEPRGEVRWSSPRAAVNGAVVTLPFTLQIERYRKFSAADWRSRLAGLSLTEAQKWLQAQPGVSSVDVSLYPVFFAKISPKLPVKQTLITLAIDIRGKTSILE